MAETKGMSDEQVEELLHALLDFRNMLVSLTDRFQNRLALLEQEFADYRNTPSEVQRESVAPLNGLKQRPGAVPLEMPHMPQVLSPEHDAAFLDDEAFSPEETDAFSIVDIDDDDDF